MRLLAAVFALAAVACAENADSDIADVPNADLRLEKDDSKRFFEIGPMKDDKQPEAGYGLFVILPGGSGSADMNPFVRRIYKNVLGAGWIAEQPVAVKWTPEQQIVWPSAKSRAEGMKYATEDFVEAIIKDAAKRHKINPAKVFTLSWSSSGHIAYTLSLRPKSGVKGSFVAMARFLPVQLPPLDTAKGHTYYLYHSKDDTTCPFADAEAAKKQLGEKGATVELVEYKGAHGWSGNVYGAMRDGVKWLLEKTQPK